MLCSTIVGRGVIGVRAEKVAKPGGRPSLLGPRHHEFVSVSTRSSIEEPAR